MLFLRVTRQGRQAMLISLLFKRLRGVFLGSKDSFMNKIKTKYLGHQKKLEFYEYMPYFVLTIFSPEI